MILKYKSSVRGRWNSHFEPLSLKENGKNIDTQNNPHKVNFWHIFKNRQISSVIKYIGVDWVLTKILRIDSKLSVDNFHILNYGRISKIEKDIDTLDPPTF